MILDSVSSFLCLSWGNRMKANSFSLEKEKGPLKVSKEWDLNDRQTHKRVMQQTVKKRKKKVIVKRNRLEFPWRLRTKAKTDLIASKGITSFLFISSFSCSWYRSLWKVNIKSPTRKGFNAKTSSHTSSHSLYISWSSLMVHYSHKQDSSNIRLHSLSHETERDLKKLFHVKETTDVITRVSWQCFLEAGIQWMPSLQRKGKR